MMGGDACRPMFGMIREDSRRFPRRAVAAAKEPKHDGGAERPLSMDILVIEDEKVLGKALQRGLQESGHQCTWSQSGSQGLQIARQQPFDAIVLDLMLPDEHGLDILAALREAGDKTPV